MTKKVAKELIDATPAKLRSAFMKKNGHRKRKNFLGLGKKTTFSSKLAQDAYNAGYKGTGGVRDTAAFSNWYAKLPDSERKTHHGSLKAKLRAQFEKGVRQEHADHLAKAKGQIAELKAEKRSSPKPPPLPEAARAQSFEHNGVTIKRTNRGFEVKGEVWNTKKQAEEYADLWRITGGKVYRKTNPKQRNPNATIKQGKARADIFDVGPNKFTVEVIPAHGATESHSFSGKGSFKTAMSWARLRLHEVANPGKRFKVYALTPNRRKNPAEPAARMYEKFHGTPSTEVREYKEEVHQHLWLAALGPLISIKVRGVNGNREADLQFPDPQDASVGDVVMLCATEDGTQLIPTGGDQELDPKSLTNGFGMVAADFARDNVLIGTITEITYRTKKSFEKDGNEEIDFFHVLGSEGSRGVYPVLIYHPRNPSLEIAGGRYYIGKAEKSLGYVSAGIIG
jgi:hypothetical protein